MPTLKQLADFYEGFIKNKLKKSMIVIVGNTFQSKERHVKLISELITILKKVNENLNQYSFSDLEKGILINNISTYLGLEKANLSFMLMRLDNNDSMLLTRYLEELLEEIKVGRK